MVNLEERARAVSQAVAVQGDDLQTCRDEANDRVAVAGEQHYRPYLGGGYVEHLTGAVGEMGAWYLFERLGLRPEYVPFDIRGNCSDGEDPRHYDFSFVKDDRQLITVDVKSGYVSHKSLLEMPEHTTFGMQTPKAQVSRDSKTLADVYVYCIVDTGADARVAMVGWCRWDAWAHAIPFKDENGVDCLRVPMCRLLPMWEFYFYIRNGMSNAKTESVKVISEV